jgi:hypothetical protein
MTSVNTKVVIAMLAKEIHEASAGEKDTCTIHHHVGSSLQRQQNDIGASIVLENDCAACLELCLLCDRGYICLAGL